MRNARSAGRILVAPPQLVGLKVFPRPQNRKSRKFPIDFLCNPIVRIWPRSMKIQRYFLFRSSTYRKNKKSKNKILFFKIINIKPVRVQFTSPNYLRVTLGQGKRLKIHGFWRNLMGVKQKRISLILVLLYNF